MSILTRSTTTNLLQRLPTKNHQTNPLFQWINIIFNRVDQERRKQLGPDRTCAEWLLRNGASVQWTDSAKYLADYNQLPDERVPLHIREVDATDSSIMHYGFAHFLGCKHISRVVLHQCGYLEDPALRELAPLNDSLRSLQVSGCLNITDKGLGFLSSLTKLEQLLLFDLPYVKNMGDCVKELRRNLPSCTVDFK